MSTPPRRTRRFTLKEIALAKQLLARGARYNAVARALGRKCSDGIKQRLDPAYREHRRRYLRRWRNGGEEPFPKTGNYRQHLTETELADLRRRFSAGQKIGVIAEAIGVTKRTVYLRTKDLRAALTRRPSTPRFIPAAPAAPPPRSRFYKSEFIPS